MTFQVIKGDCLTEMAKLPPNSVDACITDPPYGISYNPCGGNGVARRGNLAPVANDERPFDPSHLLTFPKLITWGANHYADKLPPSPSWLVWYKRDGVPSINFADCEMAWSNIGGPARVFNHLWHGMLRDSERGELRVHPTQKPVALMMWCIEAAGLPVGATILDPYMGSGSTGVAATLLGFNFIGIDSDGHYCEVARARMTRASGKACDIPKRVKEYAPTPLFEAVA